MMESILQIQPQFAQSEAWDAIAQREGLFYESIEFFMPRLLEDHLLLYKVREWHRRSGRIRSLHGAFIDINPASGDPAFQKLSRKRCQDSCLLAKELGASHVVLHSSCFPFLRGSYMEHWAATCAEFYTELARQHDLNIYVENSQDMDPDPLCALMEQVKDNRVCVCLDVGHANYSRVAMEEWFVRLGPQIAYLHLSDNMGEFDDHLPLGVGTVDWKLVDSLWQQLNRKTPITLEVDGISGVEQSLAYLKQNGFFGMEA